MLHSMFCSLNYCEIISPIYFRLLGGGTLPAILQASSSVQPRKKFVVLHSHTRFANFKRGIPRPALSLTLALVVYRKKQQTEYTQAK